MCSPKLWMTSQFVIRHLLVSQVCQLTSEDRRELDEHGILSHPHS